MQMKSIRSLCVSNENQDSLSNKLLNQNNQPQVANQSKITKIKEYFFGQIQSESRTVHFSGYVEPINYQNNLVKNTKYNVLTFIPLVLFNQFKYFFNIFFLCTALSQLIQPLKVGLFVTFIGPLILVLSLTMCKEGYDEYRTFLRDIEANSKIYQVIKKNEVVETMSKDLKVGDIVKIHGGEKIPADMLILYSENEHGILFIKTDQLDGETDWKLRKAIKKTQNLLEINNDYHQLINEQMLCEVKAPLSQIYQFNGVFVDNTNRQKLTLENTLWATTVLTNGTIIGLVVYVGRETRIAMGGSTPSTKMGILDFQINYLSKLLFLLLLIITVTMILLQGPSLVYVPVQFMRMLILLSSIIPISMRVNLDFAKLFYAYGINNDPQIQGTITRNSNCPEELGRIKYILSDKTGTLTQNQMLFKRISIDDDIKFTDQNVQEIIQMLKQYEQIPQNMYSREKFLKQIVTGLVLCHNVTPVYEQNRKQYQASSPDEITFVKMAQTFGISIVERSQNHMLIRLPSDKNIKFQILYIFPFKSETKRMGIILKNQVNGQIVFYLKGADSIMKDFIQSREKKGFIQEQCRDLAMTGLRTLVITKKKLSNQFYQKWSKKYQQVYNQFQIDQRKIDQLMFELENNVEFIGITGIEDKLQYKLKSTIESLKSASIKIWMITGDKVQTAECISRSCGLQGFTETNVKIQDCRNLHSWNNHWQNVKLNLNRVLIIDGKTLLYVLNNEEISKDFFEHSMQMLAVICCRCSPQQKRTLTKGVKKYRGPCQSVLGIGDGGNDVGMIQVADVGVGIVGKEGKQAALAADFSILEFKALKSLILWHGRLSYKRSALLASFIMHRGFIVSIIQVIFSSIFFFISIQVFNSYLQLGFATIFTFWPVFSLVLDTDIDKANALKYPKLYESLRHGRLLSAIQFVCWLWKATFQGSIIMLMSIYIFQESSYILVETICFTILILTQYCMTLSQIHRIHLYTFGCVGGSLLCYVLCMIFLSDYIQISSLSLIHFAAICGITLCSWLPLFIWKLVRKKIAPTDYEKVMQTVNRSIGRKLLHNSFNEGQNNQQIKVNGQL